VPIHSSPLRYLAALGLCTLTTLAALPLREVMASDNIVMLYLLTVLIVAVRLGREPAVLAAFLSVALFDFFFVPPHLTFSVADAQYLVTFAVMLAVGLITSHLAARLADRTREAQGREQETRALYELARDLGAALTYGQIAEILDRCLAAQGLRSGLLIDDSRPANGTFALHGAYRPSDFELTQARTAYAHNTVVAPGFLAGTRASFFPLPGTTRVRGVLILLPRDEAAEIARGQHALLQAVATLAGIAAERVHYAEIAQHSELAAQSEQLRSSLLSSISHDLRTPLAVLVGLAESLALTRPPLTETQARLAMTLQEEARRMSAQVDNLLDMARLQAGKVKLNREWQPLEEIVGSALKVMETALAAHPVRVDLPEDLPLIEFDAVLIERVLCNLLENAAKYTPPGTRILIGVALGAGLIEMRVEDDGPGLPKGGEEALFQKFERGERESTTPGVGLGLAICRAIVAAHGGTMCAENRAEGGARFVFSLPRGSPPPVMEEAMEPGGAA
jgi:two-component system, OmpR family, sensor histidine kinase KdpD